MHKVESHSLRKMTREELLLLVRELADENERLTQANLHLAKECERRSTWLPATPAPDAPPPAQPAPLTDEFQKLRHSIEVLKASFDACSDQILLRRAAPPAHGGDAASATSAGCWAAPSAGLFEQPRPSVRNGEMSADACGGQAQPAPAAQPLADHGDKKMPPAAPLEQPRPSVRDGEMPADARGGKAPVTPAAQLRADHGAGAARKYRWEDL